MSFASDNNAKNNKKQSRKRRISSTEFDFNPTQKRAKLSSEIVNMQYIPEIVTTPLGFRISQSQMSSILIEYLENNGFCETANCLSNETGILRKKDASCHVLTGMVTRGDWDNLISYLKSHHPNHLSLQFGQILILEQKYLELVSANNILLAQDVISKELMPLVSPNKFESYPSLRWYKLCNLLRENVNISLELDALNWYDCTSSRHKLCTELNSYFCDFEFEIPQNALLNMLDQVLRSQILESRHWNLQSNRVSLTSFNSSEIPCHCHSILSGHCGSITHLEFSRDGEWLVSTSVDHRAIIWSFSDILFADNCGYSSDIGIITEIVHYQAVTYASISGDKYWLITMTEHQHTLDDFAHRKLNRKLNLNSPQIGSKQVMPQMMQTGRGCNVYIWKLNSNHDCILYFQHHDYRQDASVVWCPDSEHYFVTAHLCDIDLWNCKNNQIILTLPCLGNSFTDLRLTNHGYRLCVTTNQRDVRVYITDFNNVSSKPWLHLNSKNYINLFQSNVSKYIEQSLTQKQSTVWRAFDAYSDLNLLAKESNESEHNESYNYNELDVNDQSQSESESDVDSLESLNDKLWMFHEQFKKPNEKTDGTLKRDLIVNTAVSYGGEHEYLIAMIHKQAWKNNHKQYVFTPLIVLIDLRNINQNIQYNHYDTNNDHRYQFDCTVFAGFAQNKFKLQCGFGGFDLPPLSNQALIYQQCKRMYRERLKKGMNTMKKNKNKQKRHKKAAVFVDNVPNIKVNPAFMNETELRNVRIPFCASLASKRLSDLQEHIDDNVFHHYNQSHLHQKRTFKKSKKDDNKNNNQEIEIDYDVPMSKMIDFIVCTSLKYPNYLPKQFQNESNSQELIPKLRCFYHILPECAVHKMYRVLKHQIDHKMNGNNNKNDKFTHHNGHTNNNKNDGDDVKDKSDNDFDDMNEMLRCQILKTEVLNVIAVTSFSDNNRIMSNGSNDYEQVDSSSSSTGISSETLNSISFDIDSANIAKLLTLDSPSNSHANIGPLFSHTFSDSSRNISNLKRRLLDMQQKKKERKREEMSEQQMSGKGRDSYLFARYLRSHIVNDCEIYRDCSSEIDALLFAYCNDDNGLDIDSEECHHLSMEMKYHLLHKCLKREHRKKLKHDFEIAQIEKRKIKKSCKNKALSMASKLKKARERKRRRDKKNELDLETNDDGCLNNNKLDKARMSNEDILSPKSPNVRKVNLRNNSDDDDDGDGDCDSFNDSDVNEYAAMQNDEIRKDELMIDTVETAIKNKNDNKNDNAFIYKKHNSQTIVKSHLIERDFFGGHHFIVSGSEDGNVCIWNRITQKITKIKGHDKSVGCVVWNPVDPHILVSGSDDCTIRVWTPKPKTKSKHKSH